MPTLGELVLAEVARQYGSKLSTVAKQFQVPEVNLLHLGLDPALTPDGYGDLRELFVGVVKHPLEAASCYPTARDLFPVIADGSGGASGGAPPKVRYTDAEQVRTAVNGLVTALRQAADNHQEVVFRVELAGHGFTLLVRPADPDGASKVELIETIANDSLIIPSLGRQPMSPAEVCAALVGMVGDRLESRRKSAKMLGWDADDFWLGEQTGKDPVFPNIEFRWWSGTLRSDAVGRWTEQFGQRLEVFAKLAQ